MIVLEDVGFQYSRKGHQIFHGISFNLKQGEVTALVGPNGCGKTTLGKLMTGILKPSQGRILVDGLDTRTAELSALGRKVGYLFQEPERQLFASTVTEELSFVGDIMNRPQDVTRSQAQRLMEMFHLQALANEFPFQLSRGEKQRLAIATVMMNEPEFYIFDEPTTGLDELRRLELSTILQDLSDRGTGMLIISHDRQFIQRHAQRIMRLEGGDMVEDRYLP